MEIYGQHITFPAYFCQMNDLPLVPYEKEHGIRLFVHLTNRCNANCEFCSNASNRNNQSDFNLDTFRQTIHYLNEKKALNGVSFSGGEPSLDISLLNEAINIVFDELGTQKQVAISTNGTHLADFLSLDHLNNLESIHLSRHHYLDEQNDQIFKQSMLKTEELIQIQSQLKNKHLLIFNCNVIKGYIDSIEEIKNYMEWADSIGIHKCAFIHLMPINSYCKEHEIDTQAIFTSTHKNMIRMRSFSRINCCCLDGYYLTKENRMMGYYTRTRDINIPCNDVKGLIYTADNHLKTGYGADATLFF